MVGPRNLYLESKILKHVLQEDKEKQEEKERKDAAAKKRKESCKDILKVALSKHNSGVKLASVDLSDLPRFVSRAGNEKLPTKVDELRNLWEQQKPRLPDNIAV